ncbi:Protein of unknown function [Gryllus bimaculatus]|nr:Protein of unknown function [Gryllus bimaculatus]
MDGQASASVRKAGLIITKEQSTAGCGLGASKEQNCIGTQMPVTPVFDPPPEEVGKAQKTDEDQENAKKSANNEDSSNGL